MEITKQLLKHTHTNKYDHACVHFPFPYASLAPILVNVEAG